MVSAILSPPAQSLPPRDSGSSHSSLALTRSREVFFPQGHTCAGEPRLLSLPDLPEGPEGLISVGASDLLLYQHYSC